MNYIKENFKIDRRICENELWNILVETVHSLIMYPHHKAYLIEKILPENPLITPIELSNRLSIPLGEAIVLLYELRITAKELEEELKKPLPENKKYSKVALGGTFNEIHYGHLSLLWTAFKNGEKVLIGLTSDEFAKNLKKHSIKPYSERLNDLKETLKKYNWLESSEIVAINDAYGPSIIDPTLDA
ncbi:MAG: adenylyltransferase/cytidyltransferase family protein, partial [Nitrososphaerota archaeon]